MVNFIVYLKIESILENEGVFYLCISIFLISYNIELIVININNIIF